MSDEPISGRITVGIPTYNRADLAVRAAKSVLSQTCKDVELVVSGDFFPGDDSAARIEALGPPPPGKQLKVLRQPRRIGLVSNFGACLKEASGEFFLLLGDDDELAPEALAELMQGFTHPPAPFTSGQIGLVWCTCHVTDGKGKVVWDTSAGPATESPARLLQQLWAGNRGPRLSSILVRTEDLRIIGGFESKYGDLCDLAAWGKTALAYPAVSCKPLALVRCSMHAGSATSRSAISDWTQLGRIVHADLVQRCHTLGNHEAESILRKSRNDFIASIAPSILLQSLNGPKGALRVAREVARSPRILFSRLVFKRALKDGWKLLRLLEKSDPPPVNRS